MDLSNWLFNLWSCVMIINLAFVDAACSLSRFVIFLQFISSKLDVGSSAKITLGFLTTANAIAAFALPDLSLWLTINFMP